MDIKPQTTKPISDDQELAKVLAGVSQDNKDNMGYEASPLPEPFQPEPTTPVESDAVNIPVANVPKTTVIGGGNLSSIKLSALNDLKPLVEKLNLPSDGKFDIYLLLLRSSDDKSLIAPAYKAAQEITDETKRAQALLDIIKEIDYLSAPTQA